MKRVLIVGLWSMLMLGLGVKLGGDIVKGEPVGVEYATQAEVARAWDALLVCSYDVVLAHNTMDSVLVWLSIRRGDQEPPIVRVQP